MMHILKHGYGILIKVGSLLRSPLLLLCRLYWGWLFFLAGVGKLGNIGGFIPFLEGTGIPLPTLNAYLAGGIEMLGGLCLILGLGSRLAALLLAFVMFMAYYLADFGALKALFHDPALFVAANPFQFLLVCLMVLAFGPGRFSIDYILEKWVFNKH